MKKTRLISRYQLSSSFAVGAALLAFAGPLAAQGRIESQVLVVDTERLFTESNLGAEKLRDFEQAFRALAAENKEIENALIAEEQELTQLRASLSPEEFRSRADEFDARVEQLRREQDEKERQLSREREDAQSELFTDYTAIITEIVRERGALVVIDRRNVYLSVSGIDITNETLRRFNERSEASGE